MYYTYVTCIFVTLYKIRAKRPNQKPKRIQCCSPPPPLKKKKSSISFLLPGLFIKLMQGYFLGEKYYYYIVCLSFIHFVYFTKLDYQHHLIFVKQVVQSWRNGFLRQIEQGFSIIQSCQDILQKNVFDLNSGRYPKITFWTDPPTKITGEINYKLSKNCLLSTKVYRLLYNRIIKKLHRMYLPQLFLFCLRCTGATISIFCDLGMDALDSLIVSFIILSNILTNSSSSSHFTNFGANI